MDKGVLEYKLQSAIDFLWPILSYSKDETCPMPVIKVSKNMGYSSGPLSGSYAHQSRVITINPETIQSAKYDNNFLNSVIWHEAGHYIHSVLNKETFSGCIDMLNNLSLWRRLNEFDMDEELNKIKNSYASCLVGALTYIETIASFSEVLYGLYRKKREIYGLHRKKREIGTQLHLFEADNELAVPSLSFEKIDVRELVTLFAYMDRDNIELNTAREFIKKENKKESLLEEMVRLYSEIDRQSAVTFAIRRLIHVKLIEKAESWYKTFLFEKGSVRLLESLWIHLNEMRPSITKERLPRKILEEQRGSIIKIYSKVLESGS